MWKIGNKGPFLKPVLISERDSEKRDKECEEINFKKGRELDL